MVAYCKISGCMVMYDGSDSVHCNTRPSIGILGVSHANDWSTDTLLALKPEECLGQALWARLTRECGLR